MDGSDLFDLLGGDPTVAKGMANAMTRRAQGAQGAGMILRTLTGDRDPTGGAFIQQGQHDQDQLAKAIETRPEYQLEDVKARQAKAEEQAWQDPAAKAVLRGAIGAFMPNMQVDENTPTQVLRNILPTAEKFGQSYNALSLRQALHGLQVKNDPATGETFQYDPVTGASFHMDGSPRTKGVRAPLVRPGARPAPMLGAPPPAQDTTPGAVPGSAPDATAPAPKPLLVKPGAGIGSQYPQLFGTVRQKALNSLVNDFDPNKGGGEFAKNQARSNAANRVMALAQNPDGSPRDLSPNQMPELVQSVVGLINSGSTGAQAQIEHMLPKSYSKDAAGIMQYFTDHPEGAGQQAFVQQFLDTAKREQDVAQKAIEKARDQRWAKNQPFIRGNPDEARQALQGFGWDIGPDGKPMLAPPEAEAAAAPAPATLQHFKAQLQPGERLAIGPGGKAKALGPNEQPPAGFTLVP